MVTYSVLRLVDMWFTAGGSVGNLHVWFKEKDEKIFFLGRVKLS